MNPPANKRPIQAATLRTPKPQVMAISAASREQAVFVHSSTLRRSKRSDTWPATGLVISIGMNDAKAAVPTQAADSVIWYTIQ